MIKYLNEYFDCFLTKIFEFTDNIVDTSIDRKLNVVIDLDHLDVYDWTYNIAKFLLCILHRSSTFRRTRSETYRESFQDVFQCRTSFGKNTN